MALRQSWHECVAVIIIGSPFELELTNLIASLVVAMEALVRAARSDDKNSWLTACQEFAAAFNGTPEFRGVCNTKPSTHSDRFQSHRRRNALLLRTNRSFSSKDRTRLHVSARRNACWHCSVCVFASKSDECLTVRTVAMASDH